jgi:hypothetical protein
MTNIGTYHKGPPKEDHTLFYFGVANMLWSDASLSKGAHFLSPQKLETGKPKIGYLQIYFGRSQ